MLRVELVEVSLSIEGLHRVNVLYRLGGHSAGLFVDGGVLHLPAVLAISRRR